MNAKTTIQYALIVLCAALISGCCHKVDAVNYNAVTERLLRQIESKNIDDDVLLQSISRLGRVTEPTAFWTRIANDGSYSRKHRSRSVMALFRRHALFCGDVRQLAKIIAPAEWLQDEDVGAVDVLAGKVPVMMGLDRTVFMISVLPKSKAVVYISVAGQIPIKTFITMLRDTTSVQNGIILEIGFDDDYDDWMAPQLPMSRHSSPKKTER